MPKKLTPAELVIERGGGIRPLARLIDVSPCVVLRWRERGEHVPNKIRGKSAYRDRHQQLLAVFKKKGIPLTAEELINGGYA